MAQIRQPNQKQAVLSDSKQSLRLSSTDVKISLMRHWTKKLNCLAYELAQVELRGRWDKRLAFISINEL